MALPVRPAEDSLMLGVKEEPPLSSSLRNATLPPSIATNSIDSLGPLKCNLKESNNGSDQSVGVASFVIAATTAPIQTSSKNHSEVNNNSAEVNNNHDNNVVKNQLASDTKNTSLVVDSVHDREDFIAKNENNPPSIFIPKNHVEELNSHQQSDLNHFIQQHNYDNDEPHATSLSASTAQSNNDDEAVSNLQQNDEASSSSSKTLSLLLLPGVTDRRKVLGIGEFNMTSFNTLNSDDISTEIGSESHHGCSSSVGSRSDYPSLSIPEAVNEDDQSRFALPSYLSHHPSDPNTAANSANQLPGCDEGNSTTRHRICDKMQPFMESSPFEEAADEDATPENRFVRNSNNDASWMDLRQQAMGMLASDGHEACPFDCASNDPTTIEGSSAPPLHAPPLIPSLRNVREVPISNPLGIESRSRSTRGSSVTSGLRIPGLFNIQAAPAKPTGGFLPWRVKYVSSNITTNSSSSTGIPNSHECLTDDTTADGCQDYDDDDELEEESSSADSDDEDDNYSESYLELPAGVTKKVRFLPVHDSAIHEYEKFDWGAEEEEAGIFIDLEKFNMSETFEPTSDQIDVSNNEETLADEDVDDGIKANPIQMFIPLIGVNRHSVEIEESSLSSSSSSPSSDVSLDEQSRPSHGQIESPQTHRHSDGKPLDVLQKLASLGNTDGGIVQSSESQSTEIQQEEGLPIQGGSFSVDTGRSSVSRHGRSSSGSRRNRAIKRRESTPHPSRQTSRTSSTASLSMNESSSTSSSLNQCHSNSSSSSSHEASEGSSCYRSDREASSASSARSPFFPYTENRFPIGLSEELLLQSTPATKHENVLAIERPTATLQDGRDSSLFNQYENDGMKNLSTSNVKEVAVEESRSAELAGGATEDVEHYTTPASTQRHLHQLTLPTSSKLMLRVVNDANIDSNVVGSFSSSTCSELNSLSSPISSNCPETSPSPEHAMTTNSTHNETVPKCLSSSSLLPLYPSSGSQNMDGDLSSLDSSEFLSPITIRHSDGTSLGHEASILFHQFVTSSSSIASPATSKVSPPGHFSFGILRLDSQDDDDDDDVSPVMTSRHSEDGNATLRHSQYDNGIRFINNKNENINDPNNDDEEDLSCFKTPRASSSCRSPRSFGILTSMSNTPHTNTTSLTPSSSIANTENRSLVIPIPNDEEQQRLDGYLSSGDGVSGFCTPMSSAEHCDKEVSLEDSRVVKRQKKCENTSCSRNGHPSLRIKDDNPPSS